jgi:hypothetical protein
MIDLLASIHSVMENRRQQAEQTQLFNNQVYQLKTYLIHGQNLGVKMKQKKDQDMVLQGHQ